MSRDLQVNLLFQADTTRAINNIQQLGQLLNNISTKTTIGIDGGSMQNAINSAQQLAIHLEKAVNVDTGKLDLNKLNTSLKQSNQTLQGLASNIQMVGPTGQQAFVKLANAVASSETPMIRLSDRVKDLGVTLANTIKWQIASKAVHGLESVLNGAVSHAEELNRALNDIRIVTGYSEAAMSRFAQSAAASAKELSTTTTEYSKAALIFYQQGLNGTDVTDRADTVIKLSQVTQQSAETVSAQMTAIWNNFAKGGESLEYYADVLAKLGAVTAADTQEITEGLSKFAAVADTVGLSYETAAAAVATVVDRTKQSADVVGTSFKTIFARMQGLKLGETLEDGVDLNKYSEALGKVGVRVLDAKGEMRDMDDILSDLGEKWEGLGETTQTAVAQAVGGVRQYNQMISLMDNWDIVSEHINIAKDATGELAAQQDIWAESYEASANRIKEAQNQLYESFINDKSLIGLNNVTADLINGVTKLIENFGGIGPVILTLAGVFSRVLIPVAGSAFKQLGNMVSIWTGKAEREVSEMQSSMLAVMQNTLDKGGYSEGVRQQITLSQELLMIKQRVAAASKQMSLAQREETNSRIALFEAMVAETQQLLAKKAALEEEIRLSKEKVNDTSTYSQKSSIAASEVLGNYTAQATKNGVADDYIEEVTTQATDTTRADTSKEIERLKQEKQRMAAERAQMEQDAQRAAQQAASHSAVLEQKENENTSSGIDTPDGQRHLEAFIEADDKAKSLNATLAETEGSYKTQQEVLDMQIERLETIKKLQDEIHEKASKGDVSTMSAGKMESDAFTSFASNDDQAESIGMEKSMLSNTVGEMGGSIEKTGAAEIGTISVDASMANLEKIFGAIGQYKTQLAEINAMQDDFSNGLDNEAFTELSNAFNNGTYTAEQFAASQDEVSTASAQVQSALAKQAAAQAKLDAELKKGGKGSKAAKQAQKELDKATLAVTKSQTAYAKTLKKQPQLFQKVIKAQKPLLNSKKQFEALAKSMGMSDKKIEELGKSFEEFQRTGDPKSLDKVRSALTNMGSATTNTISGLDSLVGQMREFMINAGMTDDQIDPIIAKLRELSGIAPQVGSQMGNLDNQSRSLGGSLNVTAGGIAKTAEGLATFAGQMSMAYAGAQSLAQAFEEGASPMERVSSILSGLTMILPVVAFAFKALSKAKGENTRASIANSIASAQEAIAHGANTVATWAQTAAEVALKIAQNPAVGAVVLGLVLAAGVAMAVYTSKTEAATEATKKKNEADLEQGEAVKEASNAWREQTSVMDDVIARYDKLTAAGKSTQEVLEDLKTAAEDLGDAYLEMGDKLGLLEGKTITVNGETISLTEAVSRMKQAAEDGDVDMVETYQNAIDSTMNEKGKDAADNAAKAAMSDVALAMSSDEGGAEYKDGKVTRHVGGAGNEEEDAVAILAATSLGDASDGANGIDLTLNTDDSGEFLDQYEELQQAAEKIKTELGDKADNSDTLREINEMLDASEEEYNVLKEAQAEAEKYNVFDAKAALENQTFEGSEEKMDIKNIDSLKEYEEYKTKLLENVGEDPVAQQAAEDWLAAQTHLQDYVDASSQIDYIASAEKGGAWEGKQDELQGIYDELSEEEKKLFLEVDFDEAQTKEEILAEIDKLQEEADKAERVTLAEDAGIDPKEFETYRDLLAQENEEMKELYDSAEEYEEALTQIALANKKMEKGVKKLADGWDDFDSIMSDSSATAEDVSSVLPEINEGLQDVLNLSDEEFELLPPDFAQKNWSLIQDVVNGVEGAVDDLRNTAGQEILMQVDGVLDEDGSLNEDFAGLHEAIASFDSSKFEVGVALNKEDEADFYANCQSIIDAAGMTAEQAQAYFGSMGYDVEFKKEPKTVTETVWDYTYANTYDDEGNLTSRTVQGTPKVLEGNVEVPVIETITPNGSYGGGIGVNTTAPKSATSSGGGGGGGSKPKKADEVKKSDVVERYKEINDELKQTQRLMSKNTTLADGLWGKARFDMLRKNVELMKKENNQLKERIDMAKNYQTTDQAELDAAASKAGINFNYDKETGHITNYTEEMTKLYNQLDAAIKSANADGNATEEEQEGIDKIQEKIDAVTEAIDQYEETLDQVAEDEQTWLENRNKIWTENFNILNEELELEITINDFALERLEYYLGKIEGDIFSAVEAWGLMQGQVDAYTDNLEAQNKFYEDLRESYSNGDISEPQYKEGLQQAQSATIANLESLRELKLEMQDYYGNVIAMAQEELAVYTDRMDHLNSVLDHYSSLMDILGKQKDYKTKDTILQGKAHNLKNELDTYKKEYEMYSAEADKWQEKMANAVEGTNEYETYKKNWIAAQEAAEEAQSNMMAKTEEWAEAMRAIVENELAGLADDLEKTLTGGLNFDMMLNSMERASSLQEEYLTTTNKIYETNKLMRSVQQEIDKTSNDVAKRRMKEFIAETKHLQSKGQLSQYELDIQQAKYDLLLAEIALEEAQNAKSTVRLQRDSEGNFGYVYTADSSKIAEAQQKMEDAQNSLYNIGLEGANDYNQKYAEAMSEMYNELTELQTQYLEGAFATEQEYQDAVTATKEYYYEKLKQYSELYQIAVTTDTRVIADAWSSDFNEMMTKTDQWKVAIDNYTDAAAESLSTWTGVVSTILSDSGLDNVDKEVASIKKESDLLKESIIGKDGKSGLVAAIHSEVIEAGKLSEAYIGVQNAIDGVITSQEEFLGLLNQEYAKPTKDLKDGGDDDDGNDDGENPTQTPSGPDKSSATTKRGIALAIWNGNYGWGEGQTRKDRLKAKGFDPEEIQKLVNDTDPSAGWGTRYGITDLSQYAYSKFDTGGYTGSWGSYGKMAMLHEKELVLNQGDTDNFLMSMELLDNIVKTIDLQAANAALGGLLSSPQLNDMNQKDVLEQSVTIEANFPNVSSRQEIEEAFTTLVNRASQYANRK